MYRRCALFSLLLCAFLGSVSVWFYRSVPQSRTRLKMELGEVLGRPVGVYHYRTSLSGPTTVRALVIEAAPVIEQRSFLRLNRIRQNHGGPLEVAEATVFVESVPTEDPEEGRGERWNYEELPSPTRLYRYAVRRPFAMNVAQATLGYVRTGLARSQATWSVKARDLELTTHPAHGVTAQATLDVSQHVSGGAVQVEWLEPTISVQGRFEGCAGLSTWLPLLTEEWRQRWARLELNGKFDLHLSDARLRNGKLEEFKGELRYYDASVRAGPRRLSIDQLRGAITFTQTGLRWGEDEPLRGRLWGGAALLRGRLDAEHEELQVEIPAQPLRRWTVGRGGPAGEDPERETALARAFRFLDLDGVVAGELEVPLGIEEAKHGKAQLRFRKVTSASLPFVDGVEGEWRWDAEDARSTGESRKRGASVPGQRARLHLERIRLGGIGTLRGDADYTNERGVLTLEFNDLRLTEPRDGERRHARDTAPQTNPSPFEMDSLSGSVSFQRPATARTKRARSGGLGSVAMTTFEAGLTLKLKWIGLRLENSLLRSAQFSGTLRKDLGEELGHGRFELRAASIPGGKLEGEGERSLEFPHGRGELALAERELRIVYLVLSSQDRLLRLRGEIQLDGGVHCVCVLADGENYAFRDQALDHAPLAEWKRVAGVEAFRAYRFTGSLQQPAIRPIGPRDPVFVVVGD